MKKMSLVALAATVMIMTSCTQAWWDETTDNVLLKVEGNNDLYTEPFPEEFAYDSNVPNLAGLARFLDIYIEYDYNNIFPTPPKVTMEERFGDCDSQALLIINYAYIFWGMELGMALVDSLGMPRTVAEGGWDLDHAMLYTSDGRLFGTWTGLEYTDQYPIKYYYNFDELFPRAKAQLEASL